MLLLLGVLVYSVLFAAMLALSKGKPKAGWLLYTFDGVAWIVYGCLLKQWVWIPFNVILTLT